MRSAMRRFLTNFEEIIAGVALVAMVGLIVYGIVNRYVLQRPSVWAPELAGLFFTWAVFLGAAAAWKRDMHISIDFIATRMSPRVQSVIGAATDVIILMFLAYANLSRYAPVDLVPYTAVAGPEGAVHLYLRWRGARLRLHARKEAHRHNPGHTGPPRRAGGLKIWSGSRQR